MKEIDGDKLKQMLNLGIVSFTYEKTDGKLRDAVGTTNSNKIPVLHLSKGGTTPGEKISYFDIEKDGWRSVSIKQKIFV